MENKNKTKSDEYNEKFGEYVFNKYSSEEEPYDSLMPGYCAGIGWAFPESQYEQIYDICLKENKPWQEIEELRNHVENWWKRLDSLPDNVCID